MITDQDLQRIFYKASIVAGALDSAAKVLRKLKELIPTPLMEELRDFIEGKRPLTSEAALYVILHDTIPGVEEMADNIRRITPEFMSRIEGWYSSDLRLDAIKQYPDEELRSEP